MTTLTDTGVKLDHSLDCKLHLRGWTGVERAKSFSFGVEPEGTGVAYIAVIARDRRNRKTAGRRWRTS
jgi:hypothetical protein